MTFNVEVEGLDVIKKMFIDMEAKLRPSETRKILDAGGKVIAQTAKGIVPLKGEIGRKFRQDISVYRDNRKSAKNAEYVIIGPRFKQYQLKNNRSEKVAIVAQHMTIGFRQTDRRGRGRVKDIFSNPILNAYKSNKNQVNDGINNGLRKQLQKVKSKFSGVVK